VTSYGPPAPAPAQALDEAIRQTNARIVATGWSTEERKPSSVAVTRCLRFDQFCSADANSRFGFSAKNTLGLAQALYEAAQGADVSETDSRAFAGRFYWHGEKILWSVIGPHTWQRTAFVTGSCNIRSNILDKTGYARTKRIFNNAKVSDTCHHANHAGAARPVPSRNKSYAPGDESGFLAIFYRRPCLEFLRNQSHHPRSTGEPSSTRRRQGAW